jgi:hypothetical protein
MDVLGAFDDWVLMSRHLTPKWGIVARTYVKVPLVCALKHDVCVPINKQTLHFARNYGRRCWDDDTTHMTNDSKLRLYFA